MGKLKAVLSKTLSAVAVVGVAAVGVAAVLTIGSVIGRKKTSRTATPESEERSAESETPSAQSGNLEPRRS